MALAQTSRDALELAAYSDADFAADMTDRKLLTGGVVLLNGMEVAWSAKVQCGLLLSNMEAEFVAASEVARVIIGLRQVLVEMCMGMAPFVPILLTWITKLPLARSTASHQQAKHIYLRHKFAQKYACCGIVQS